MEIRVLLVDDHRIVREGLKLILGREKGIDVVGEAADGREAVATAAKFSPNVVVMDISMPGMNGIEATRQIAAAFPSIRVLILSTRLDRIHVVEALKAGAQGYLVKDCTAEELMTAIRAVHQGKPYFGLNVTELVVNDYMQNIAGEVPAGYKKLSKRELEVLQAIADGKSTKEIAFTFGVSVKTVETQRMNIMKKLNLYSIAELTKYAVREGLTCLGQPTNVTIYAPFP